jgi:hypothetical protein
VKVLTLIVAVAAAVLVAASPALADVRQDVRAPGNTSWTGGPSGSNARSVWGWDVRQGTRIPASSTWTGLHPANASWTVLRPAAQASWTRANA